MKTLFKLSIVCFIAIAVTFFISNSTMSQVSKDLSARNYNFNNPLVTYGPELDNAVISFFESFENAVFPPAGWIKLNPDGGTGWNRQIDGNSPIPGWGGGTITTPPLGGVGVAFCTWNTGGNIMNDQWLVTPQLVKFTSDDSLSFWLRFWPDNVYSDTVDIKLSTTTPDVAGFTTNIATIVFPRNSPDTNWTEYKYRIGDLIPDGCNYYIAFRERVVDNLVEGASVSLDLVSVTTSAICDPGTPHIEILDYPGTVPGSHMEGRYVFQKQYLPYFPEDTVFAENHCGLNVIKEVDPCNPWVLEFYVAFFEDENDKVLVNDPQINWDTTICQDLRFEYVYPPDYISGTYCDSVVMKVTMIPHPADGCTLNSPYICINGDTVYNYACWNSCIHERITFSCIDSCEIPNTAVCNVEYDKALPIELNSFAAVIQNENVTLNWTTATEKDNSGFDVERKSEGNWNKIGFVNGKGNSEVPTYYTFTDKNVNSGSYSYRLKQIDYNGNFNYYELEGNVNIGIPDVFSLSQNYPNPFNPFTSITISLPNDGNVMLKIYDLSGREIVTVINEFKTAGYYTINFNASNLASGVYYYKLTDGNHTAVNKMVVLK